MSQTHTFQAEISQLLDILVHSLYKERDIFLREMISNASDALNRFKFEMLTNQDVLDPEVELQIHITMDKDAGQIRIRDTGIGLTADEMVENLGVIAQSGAKSFLERIRESGAGELTADVIGQFGVGFYSVFMVADQVEVISRSYQPDAQAARWVSDGGDTYEVSEADKTDRGTEIIIHLRDDAQEYTEEYRLREIIRRYSDFVMFPIYIGEPKEATEDDPEPQPLQPVNQQTAIWRRSTSELDDEDYNAFYKSLTLDFEDPLLKLHTQADAPLQFYALLFIPNSPERNIFSPRTEPGLKLYARKVLIEEYTTDLLPEYLQFVHGVVDSEDIKLNVSRESIQANPLIAKLKSILTKRILGELEKLATTDPDAYLALWQTYSVFLKQGAITDPGDRGRLLPLMRFRSLNSGDDWITFEAYAQNFAKGQDAIYYIIADDVAAAERSPHLEPFRARGIDVLYMTDRVDGFLVSSLIAVDEHRFVSVDSAALDLEGIGTRPEINEDDAEALPESESTNLVDYIKGVLGDQVESVRVSKVLSSGSPARLVAPEGAMDRHTQRVYQMLEKEFEVPSRILEINPHHPIVRNLSARLERGQDDAQLQSGISLLFQNAMLADGIHPNPAEMVNEIQRLLEVATQVED
ncbi:MAG: molecular chaperone HtpG [Chloroflexi bacterium]|nr:molecular chaperone HtpG [Chloroflexota bacterium]